MVRDLRNMDQQPKDIQLAGQLTRKRALVLAANPHLPSGRTHRQRKVAILA
jgi:hypothetical protein